MAINFKHLVFGLGLVTVLSASQVKTFKTNQISDGSIDEVLECIMNNSAMDKSFGLKAYADNRIYFCYTDSFFLTSFINDTIDRLSPFGFGSDSAGRVATVKFPSKPKVLTIEDIDHMMDQLKSADNHLWDVSKLGFSKKNKKKWYSISKPVFTVDGKRAIVKVVEHCPDGCGNGSTYLLTKRSSIWKSETIAQWEFLPDLSKFKD
ncbi:MAG: hypothetical protein V4613_08215 [Bacteroidota bacterium]